MTRPRPARLPVPPRRLLPTILPALAVLALLLGGTSGPFVSQARAAEGDVVLLADALHDLGALKGFLKASKSNNDDIIGGVNAVGRALHGLLGPEEPEYQEVPEGASEEERKEIQDANKKLRDAWEREMKAFEKEAEKFRKDALDALQDALVLERVQRGSSTNMRDDVNRRAAEVLGGVGVLLDESGRAKLSRSIQGLLDSRILRRHPKKGIDTPPILLEEVFATLARINDPATLKWFADNYIHTKSSPTYLVDWLVAAQKAMILFQEVDGKTRYDIVKAMITTYAGTESQANQSTTDKNVQAAKVFWDRVRTDVIKVVQTFAKEPTDEQGQLLATMADFQAWFRKNDNARKEPWLGAWPTKPEQGNQ